LLRWALTGRPPGHRRGPPGRRTTAQLAGTAAVAKRPAAIEPAIERHPVAAAHGIGERDVETLAPERVALHGHVALTDADAIKPERVDPNRHVLARLRVEQSLPLQQYVPVPVRETRHAVAEPAFALVRRDDE
jgi:hypothetical protein